MTTLISLNAQYARINIIWGILVNLIFVYVVLKASDFIDRSIGVTGSIILRIFFGIILLAMSIKLIRSGI
jgi:multiple antibiotic resistance protein